MTAVVRIPVQDVPPIGRTEATKLARAEYERFLALLRALGPDDWDRPTDCTGWTVRDMLGHLLGMMKLQADPEKRGRQIKTAAERATADRSSWS